MINLTITALKTDETTLFRFTLPQKSEASESDINQLRKIVTNIMNHYDLKWDKYLGVSASNPEKTTIGIDAEIETDITFQTQDIDTIKNLFESVATFTWVKPIDVMATIRKNMKSKSA